MHVDQLGGEVGVGAVGRHEQFGLDRPDHLHRPIERRRLEHQHVRTRGQRQIGRLQPKNAGLRSDPRHRRMPPVPGCSSHRRSSAPDARGRNRTKAAQRPKQAVSDPGSRRCADGMAQPHIRWRPVVRGDPSPAMIQLAGGVAPAAATAHDEDAHRRFVERRAFHHVVEETQAIGAPVAGPRIERRIGAELNIAKAGVAAIAVRPGTEDQPLRSPVPDRFRPV